MQNSAAPTAPANAGYAENTAELLRQEVLLKADALQNGRETCAAAAVVA